MPRLIPPLSSPSLLPPSVRTVPGLFFGLLLPLPEHPWVNLASLILGQALWRNRWTFIQSYSPAWQAAAHVYFLVMGIALPAVFNE